MLGKLTVAGLPGLRSKLAFLRGEMVAGPDGSCVVFALVRVPAMGSTGSGTDLDAAIDVSRKAVAATPLDHHPARAACSYRTRTCLLVRARSQHDFADSARRSGVRRCSASPLTVTAIFREPSGVVVR